MAQDENRQPDPRLRTAAALSYTKGDAAPRVTAAGKGFLADRIVELAQKSGVPVVEDRFLAGLLAELPPGVQIPENAYRAAAAVFAFLDRAKGGKWF